MWAGLKPAFKSSGVKRFAFLEIERAAPRVHAPVLWHRTHFGHEVLTLAAATSACEVGVQISGSLCSRRDGYGWFRLHATRTSRNRSAVPAVEMLVGEC